MDHDELVNKRAARIARDHGCTVAEVNAALDRHPIKVDRDQFLRRNLGLELLKLDELEEAFHSKAMSGDVAAGTLLVKIHERRATLLGLSPPILNRSVWSRAVVFQQSEISTTTTLELCTPEALNVNLLNASSPDFGVNQGSNTSARVC